MTKPNINNTATDKRIHTTYLHSYTNGLVSFSWHLRSRNRRHTFRLITFQTLWNSPTFLWNSLTMHDTHANVKWYS